MVAKFHKKQKRIINWIDEIICVCSIVFSIPVEIILANGVVFEFPGDIVSIIHESGIVDESGVLVVTGGVVKIVRNDRLESNIKIKIGKSIAHEFKQ